MYKIESCFDYKGYKLVVILTDLGHRCGYIGIPKGYKWYGIDYTDDKFPSEIYIHGGITFSEHTYTYPLRRKTGLYWIGFDCGHYGDKVDYVSAQRYKITEHLDRLHKIRSFWKGEVRTLKFCKKELIRYVDELSRK